MAFKDIWKDLQDATEGIAGSGDDVSAEPINTIAHAVIDNETNLVGKVDKVSGKGLSSNDFTDDDKSKLDGLSNYDDTEIIRLISEEAAARSTADEGKADKTEVAANDNALKLDITALKEKSIPHTTSSGYPISLTDHLNDEQVIDYKIYGNSTQDGTPSTDSPVEIQSVGDLVTDTASEHYGKYAVPVKVSGKNLFKYATAERANASLVEDIFDDNGNKIGAVLQGASNGSNPGSSFNSNGWFRPGNLPNSNNICPKLYTGQTVTVSVDYKILEAHENFNGQVGLYLMSRNSSDGYATGIKSVTAGNQYRLSHTYTIKTKETYEWYPVVTLNSCKVEVKNFQIEFGTANTDYEPYQEPVTEHIYLDEPLRKIGDYADYIDYKNQNVVRQIEVLDDTGTKTIDESLGLLAEPTTEAITVPDLITPDSGAANVSTSTSTQPSSMDVTYYQDINKIITELKNAILAQGGNV